MQRARAPSSAGPVLIPESARRCLRFAGGIEFEGYPLDREFWQLLVYCSDQAMGNPTGVVFAEAELLAPAGTMANAILAGVTDTPALRLISGHEKLMAIAKKRKPAQAPDHAGRCGAVHCGAVPSGDVLDDREHFAGGWRPEPRRIGMI